MSAGAAAAAAAAAGAAARANALKASGSIVRVEPEVFLEILGHSEDPLVVHAMSMFLGHHQLLTSYKGLTFYARSTTPVELPEGCETIVAEKIWIPS